MQVLLMVVYHIESHAVIKIEYRNSDETIVTSDLKEYQKRKSNVGLNSIPYE